MAEVSKYQFIGVERIEYNKKDDGSLVQGYSIYIIEVQPENGYKFLLNRQRKPFFMNDEKFHNAGFDTVKGFPKGIKNVFYDLYGNISSVEWA